MNPGWAMWVTLACVQAGQAQAGPAERAPPSQVLRVNETIQAQHGANERIVYAFDIVSETPQLIRVEQRGLDLILELEYPNGVTTRYDSPVFRDDDEYILLDHVQQGQYQIALFSEELTDATGGHSISLIQLELASSDLSAWRMTSQAGAANAAGRHEEATRLYDGASRAWNRQGNPRRRAFTLYCAAMIEYWWLGNWPKSAQHALQAGALYADDAEPALAANATQLRGLALIEQANEVAQSDGSSGLSPERRRHFDEALRLLDDAARVHESQQNTFDLAATTNHMGLAHYYMGNSDRARANYLRAESLYRSAGELRGQLQTQNNLAVLDTDEGRHHGAATVMERSLALLPPGRELQLRADLLDNLGNTYRQIGNIDESLRAFSTALAIHQDIEDRLGEGRSLYGLGQTYFSFGELELARAYLERGLLAVQDANDGRTHHMVLLYLGDIAYLEREYATALTLHSEALELATSPQEKAWLGSSISRDLIKLGRSDEALGTAGNSVRTAEVSGSPFLLAQAKLDLARALHAQGELAQARSILEEVLRINESLGLHARIAEVLRQLALTVRAQGELVLAAEYGEQAIAHLENLRGRLADPQLRAFYLSTRREYFDAQIATLMSLHRTSGDDRYMQQALATSERSRARMMVDLLNEASVDLYRNVSPAMLERRAELSNQLAALQARRNRMLRQADGSTTQSLSPLLAEMANVENELHLLDTDLRRRSPNQAGRSGARVLEAGNIQTYLDPDTVLLQYALGESQSYVWVVTHDTMRAVELPPGRVIADTARSAFENLRRNTAAAQSTADDNLAALARLVLEPITADLERRRILVVAEGALQYVPFGLLRANPDAPGERLLFAHEVIVLPSMSALAALPQRDKAAKALAVFADPVFERNDPRFDKVTRTPQSGMPARAIATRQVATPSDLKRLALTGREADWIAANVAADDSFIAKGFAASRETVLTTDLQDYRYVHFATHGLIDARYPTLSALALAQFDRAGDPVNGFLRLHDIFRLNLNADLVVLSACDTALGREVRGEGLMGLTQGFFYAGARTLLVSLWQVPDRATATLMREFYNHLISGRTSAADALRKAQMTIATNRRWRDPYFWGAFIVLGDWR